jgi:predicted nucleotidyltransferase
MSRSARIDLPPDHRQLVLDVLRTTLPHRAKAWVFGSRATGRARRYSDLDLAIDAGRRLTLDETAKLAEALGDSDLPYRVDVVDWRTIDDRFRALIAGERVPLAEAAHPDAAIGAGPGTSRT